MTDIEIKAAELRQSMETAKAEAAEAKAKAEALEQSLKSAQDLAESQRTEIANLDASAKAAQSAIDEIRKALKKDNHTSFAEVLRDVMTEHKEDMTNFIESKSNGKMSYKFTTDNITGSSIGNMVDPNVHAAPVVANAMLDSFVHTTQTGNILEWLDGSDTDNTGYVGEFSAPTASTYAVAGKTRKFAKIATCIEVSQEMSDWYNAIYQWARTRGIQRLLKKADSLVWSGDGNDSTAAGHVYGLKASGNTAFAATGAKYAKANVADVIADSVAQIKAAGYAADIALVSYAIEAQIRGLKDANGNYLYNQVTGMLGGVRIIPSDQLGASEVLVADSHCVEIVDKGDYELEIERVASKDGWAVYLRKTFQVKVPTTEKLGVIYVADTAAAITAIKE